MNLALATSDHEQNLLDENADVPVPPFVIVIMTTITPALAVIIVPLAMKMTDMRPSRVTTATDGAGRRIETHLDPNLVATRNVMIVLIVLIEKSDRTIAHGLIAREPPK